MVGLVETENAVTTRVINEVGAGAAAISAEFARQIINPSKWERVIYYRKPEGFRQGRESRWIDWGDTQAPKMLIKIANGWQPMPQYGAVPGKLPDAEGHMIPDSRELWTPLLTHRDGPAECPASMVKQFRWYKPEGLPGTLMGSKIFFPQLVAALASGEMELVEYVCPECRRGEFHEAWQLAVHLKQNHKYQLDQVLNLGVKIGVNFEKQVTQLYTAHLKTDFAATVLAAPPPEAQSEPDPAIPIRTVVPDSEMRTQYTVPSPAPVADQTDLIGHLLAQVEAMQAENQALRDMASGVTYLEDDEPTTAPVAEVLERLGTPIETAEPEPEKRGPGRPPKHVV